MTKEGWQLIEKIKTVGPMAMRDIVVPLNLENVEHDGKVKIKMETGFMFWEVDYVGIDYSKNVEINTEFLSPTTAFDHKGIDITQRLNRPDENYFTQPNIGDEAIVNFSVTPCNQNQSQSLFLQNKGYYNYIRNYKGLPDVDYLKSFQEVNAFTQFSENAYFDFTKVNLTNTAYHE